MGSVHDAFLVQSWLSFALDCSVLIGGAAYNEAVGESSWRGSGLTGVLEGDTRTGRQPAYAPT